MPSGLNIQDGLYIEEPVRTGLTPRQQSRQVSPQIAAYIQYDAEFRCKWCGTAQSVSPCCQSCGGPR